MQEPQETFRHFKKPHEVFVAVLSSWTLFHMAQKVVGKEWPANMAGICGGI